MFPTEDIPIPARCQALFAMGCTAPLGPWVGVPGMVLDAGAGRLVQPAWPAARTAIRIRHLPAIMLR